MTSRTNEPPIYGGSPPLPPVDLPDFHVDEGPMRAELRRQIARLEQELTALVVASCPWEPRQANPVRGPAVQSGASLEQIRDELLAALQTLSRRIENGDPAPAPPSPERRPRRLRRGRSRDES